ncbi:arginyltransferase [Endozoicomonas elysicola]|uniref:Aspartate/glutamate leucyltransferase n=1 Tax=Endozoicomonas elysicola TaxID=305900 RepID=A0A081KC77_9GAMM|nr:arginyltransferase [Endozoicomonas elysicola]KEI71753.1 arginyl-tRNA-protein transferase [Endozoicomonas elysicola]
MSQYKDLKFYATQPHECSYLPEEQATTLFMDPEILLDQQLCSDLAELGFRRSGQHIYRPHCSHCKACIPARIPVKLFMMRRTQRKTWNRNLSLMVDRVPASYQDEHYQLYERYINQCHQDGDMYPASVEQYSPFLVESPPFTSFYEFRLKGQLLAVSVVDHLKTSLSAIYTFYDPDFSQRSLGKYCILWLIQEAKKLGLPYLQLGYWIRNCQKMNYKIEYRPVELYISQEWRQLK